MKNKSNTRHNAAIKAWNTIHENQYEDILTDRAELAVKNRKLSERAKKAWITRKSAQKI